MTDVLNRLKNPSKDVLDAGVETFHEADVGQVETDGEGCFWISGELVGEMLTAMVTAALLEASDG